MVIALMFILLYGSLTAQDTSIIKLSDHEYKLSNLVIDTDLKEISIPGKINMQKGLIEVFACSPGGKLHESLIVLDVRPYYLQVALLLLGLNPVEAEHLTNDEDLQAYANLEIWVRWDVDTVINKYRAEALIWDSTKKEIMQEMKWIFRGSMVVNGIFAADEVKSLITTYADPTTIIDNPLITRQNDEVYSVNSKITPPKGTDVEVILIAKTE